MINNWLNSIIQHNLYIYFYFLDLFYSIHEGIFINQ